ncbi:MAG TPA: hypothetical protein VFT31_13365 [Kribbella sp.]|nr:hypothetical protein [Kribbella sp.]
MAGQKGRELDPRSPEHQWVAGIIRTVERRTGVPSRWNGRLFEELDAGSFGAALADGGMTVNPVTVMDTVRRAYTGRQLSADEHLQLRNSVLTITHEAVHLTVRMGDATAPGAHPTHDEAGRALEEGLAESWTHEHVNSVIFEIGMHRVTPGVIGIPSHDAYPAYSGAANGLLDDLAAATGVSRPEMVRRVLSSDRADRWNAVADQLINHRLGGLMPEQHRAEIRDRLTEPLRARFTTLPQVQQRQDLDPTAKLQYGWQVGRHAVAGMTARVDQMQAHYLSYQPAAAQVGQQSAANPGVDKLRSMMAGQASASAAPGHQTAPGAAATSPAGDRGRSRHSAGPSLS